MRQQQEQMWLDSNQQETKEEEIKQQNIEKFLKLGKDGYMQDCLVSFPAAIEAANAVSPGEDLKVNLTEINEMCDKDTTLVESYTNKSSSSPQQNQTLN